MDRRAYAARKLFELSGFLPVGGFLLEHLYQNFQAVGPGGAERFDRVVVELQTNPIIIFLEIGVIALPLLYHAAYGLFVAQMARPNNGAYGTFRNWTYTLQRVTGLVLVAYIAYHVWNTRLLPVVRPDTPLLQQADGHPLVSSAYMHAYLGSSHLGLQVLWIYVVGLTAAVFHFANGVWNLGVHWGLTVGPRAQRISGLACGLLGAALLSLGLTSLLAFSQMGA
jgi:succinate dehydrogenase / fumarate reductase cytochrome b subunit